MLQKGSKILLKDNSGAKVIRIFHLGIKKTYKKSSVSYNNIIKGSIIKHEPNRKLKRKEKVFVLIVNTKKKKSRKNGCYLNFFFNKGIVVSDKDKRKPVATKSKLTVTKEVKQDKKNKLIYKIVTRSL